MKERDIRKKIIEILKKDDWVVWYPVKVRYKKEIDIFGVFDLICVRNNQIKFIQFTTLSNIRSREKKVLDFLIPNKLNLDVEIWGMRKDKSFKVIIPQDLSPKH